MKAKVKDTNQVVYVYRNIETGLWTEDPTFKSDATYTERELEFLHFDS